MIACPTGGPEVAHQIINTGRRRCATSRSTRSEVDACEYPDSRKVAVFAGLGGERRLSKVFRAETTVDYYDREPF